MQAKPLPEFTVDDMQRLLARIEVDGNGCWVVQNVAANDYGEFKKNHLTYPAHRVSYQMFKGEVPTDRVIDHQCPGQPNRSCVNPQHLALATQKQNIRNAYPKCTLGHEKRFPNAFENAGKLQCVACFLAKLAKQSSRTRLVPGGLCSRGHALSWENVYEYEINGCRQVHCKSCSLERAKSQYPARQQAKKMPEMNADAQRRFLAKIKRTANGCWEWQGQRHKGYGRYAYQGLSYPAHRIAYQLQHGKIDHFWQIDHLCNNKVCCNPAHLEPVTPDENRIRARARRPQFNKPRGLRKTHRNVTLLFMPPEGHLTVQQLSERIGVEPKKIHRWIDRRDLPSYKRNKLRYVVWVDFKQWASSRQVDLPVGWDSTPSDCREAS